MNRILSVCLLSVFVALSGCATFPTSLKQVEAAAPAQRALPIEKWQTDGGARVLFVRAPTLPMLDVRVVFDAGSARDGDEPGLARLTSALIGEGAENLSVDEIARGFEEVGASFSTGSYRDMAVVELRTLTDAQYFDRASDLFVRALGTPTFPKASLERIRNQTLVGLRREKQVPGPQIQKAFYTALFDQHPYAHDSTGTEQSLQAISRDDIANFYRTYYSSGNAVIAMTGDLTRAEAEALAQKISAALPQGERAPAIERADINAGQVQHLDFDSSQTILMLGQQSIWRGHPDYVPLYVGNQILGGGGFASILTEEVREKRGYVYGIGSDFSPMAAAGPFTVQLQTANENASDALTLTLQLVRDFIDNGPTPEQLEATRQNLIGNFALTAAENDEIVGHLGAIGFYDLPLDYLNQFEQEVRAVTVEQVREAFQRNLDVERLVILSIGPQAPQVKDTGADADIDTDAGTDVETGADSVTTDQT